ncbi:MAG: 2-oxoacid:acceptor oxidoreductase family protein [Chloroflexota bacterium]
MADRVEVLVSGFGGQGVVRVGQILSTAAAGAGLHTTMLVSHGTETRGGYVRSQIVISDELVDSPVVESADFLCVLSQPAYDRFKCLARGPILYDPAYVRPDESLATSQIGINARDLAMEQVGREIFANVIMLGYLSKMMEKTLSKDAVLAAMLERIPRLKEENTRAFDLGYSLAAQ